MSDDQIRTILVAIAEVKAEVRQIRADNVRGEKVHEEHDGRLTFVERALWVLGGFALASGGGWLAVASKVLG